LIAGLPRLYKSRVGENTETPELSVVIPVFDEAANLPRLVEELAAALRPLGRRFEVLFVDDGSTDGSPAVLRGLAAVLPGMRRLRFPENRGQTAAFAAGFRAARGRFVVTLDADLQNDPADIPRLLDSLSEADAVLGVRRRRADGLVRRVSSRIANAVRDAVVHDGAVDTGCSLKAFRREILDRIRLFRGLHRFLPALVRLEGGRVVQIEVNHRPRAAGRSKYGIANRLFAGLSDLLAVRWMISRRIDDTFEEEDRA
jgi:glycosyltransferase involved in cell wall biosynthesis